MKGYNLQCTLTFRLCKKYATYTDMLASKWIQNEKLKTNCFVTTTMKIKTKTHTYANKYMGMIFTFI